MSTIIGINDEADAALVMLSALRLSGGTLSRERLLDVHDHALPRSPVGSWGRAFGHALWVGAVAERERVVSICEESEIARGCQTRGTEWESLARTALDALTIRGAS